MANEIITTLHPDQDPDTNLYPNIKKENIPNYSIDTNKLDGNVLSLIGSLKPSGVDTSTNILAFTTNKGIYVGSDTNNWYYWDGSHYVSGGAYVSSVANAFEGAYISNDKNIYYDLVGTDNIIYVTDNINVVINSTYISKSLTDINTDNPTTTSLDNGVLSITLAMNSLLVYDTTNQKILVIGRYSINNNHIVLIKTSSLQIIGGVLFSKILSKEILFEKYKNDMQVYNTDNIYSPTIEEKVGTGNSIYFKSRTTIATRPLQSTTLNTSQIATQLGVSLTTAYSGLTDCIEIPSSKCLVFNVVTSKYELVNRDVIKKYHLILLSCIDGRNVNGLLDPYKLQLYYDNRIQLYVSDNFYPYIECDRINKKIFFTFNNIIVVRNAPTNQYTISQLATQLGVTLVTSTNGRGNCIEIPDVYCLVFSLSKLEFEIINRSNITNNDIVLIASVGGKIVDGLFKHYKKQFDTDGDYNNFIQEYPKTSEFVSLLNDSVENDTLLFFTDPHTFPHDELYDNLLENIIKYNSYIPFDCVLCGGDWLTSGDSVDNAKYKLSSVSKNFIAKIKNYYNLVGNHDLNYFGVTQLSNRELINIYNRKEKSNYYKFKTNYTTYYCLDTGDESTSMNSYRWQQIDWLANQLLQNDDKHNVIAMHIYWGTNSNLTDMATNLNSLIIAYNTKTSVTLNSITYDFSNVTGHIEYVLCGHNHLDRNDKIGNIPVFSTINACVYVNNVISFDMIYADYDNRLLSLVRVGTGSNREFDLDTGNLIE